jgi:hypothetical protein
MSNFPTNVTGATTSDTAVLTAEDVKKGIALGRIQNEARGGKILHSAHTLRGADGTDTLLLIFQNAFHAKEFGPNPLPLPAGTVGQ